MTLCILGKDSIKDLESWVQNTFNKIPNRNTSDPALNWWGKVMPYTEHSSATLLEVVPIAESRTISLSWYIIIYNKL